MGKDTNKISDFGFSFLYFQLLVSEGLKVPSELKIYSKSQIHP